MYFSCVWAHFDPIKVVMLTASVLRRPVTRRSRRALHRRVRRTPWRALCSRSRLHLAQASCRHRVFAFWLLFGSFSPLSHKRYGELLHSCCLVCNSVYFCSHTAFSSELPHLLPPSGLGVCLFRGTGAGLRRPLMCCLVYLLTGLSPLQLCLPCHLLFV